MHIDSTALGVVAILFTLLGIALRNEQRMTTIEVLIAKMEESVKKEIGDVKDQFRRENEHLAGRMSDFETRFENRLSHVESDLQKALLSLVRLEKPDERH